MKNILVSFVVPVYNVEKYIEECIGGIRCQMDERCECIIVDDGSTDRSGEICDHYADRDGFKVIHKANGGLSSARNSGMNAAKGKYIAFIDSDDRICKGSVSMILKEIENSETDIFFMNCVKFDDSGKYKDLAENIDRGRLKDKPKIAALKYIAGLNKFPGSSCTKIYRAGFLKENKLTFIEGKFCEDLFFNRDAFINAESFDHMDIPYYEYRQNREGSITTVNSREEKSKLDFIKDTAAKYSCKKKATDDISEIALSFAAYEYAVYMWISDNPQEEYSWVLSYGKSKRTRFIYLLSKIFGINKTKHIISLVKGA